MFIAWLVSVMGYMKSLVGRAGGWMRYQYIRQLKLYHHPSITQPRLDDLSDEDIMYHSEHFIVANKGSDVVINSEDPKYPISFSKQLAHKFPEAVDPNMKFHFRFLHRLDYATSGAICVALTKLGARRGHKAFEKHYVTKHYLALARGHLDPDRYGGSGHDINLPIGQDASEKSRCVMCTPARNPHCTAPRHASTRVVLLEHGTYDREPASKLLLIPHTGRTHQLRVHLQCAGHPIVGDYTYSGGADWKPARMMLHAHRLIIPMKHEHIDVIAPDTFTPHMDTFWQPGAAFEAYEKYIAEYGLRTEKQPVRTSPQIPSS